MGYAALKTLGALWSIIRKDGAAVNKSLDVRVRKTENDSVLRCKKFQLTRPRRLLTVKLCFNEPVKAKVSLLTPEQKRVTQDYPYEVSQDLDFQVQTKAFTATSLSWLCLEAGACVLVQCFLFAILVEYTIWDFAALKNRELCRNWGYSRKNSINQVKALQLQTITGLVFQEYVAGIKNTNVVQETPWQGRDAFRVQLDLSRELVQAIRVLSQILKGGAYSLCMVL
ncbi:hypothetical protein Bca101_050763 [Brassica carinata]